MTEEKMELKTGYTTGSSATAAAKAALLSIINQEKIQNVGIILPKNLLFKFQYILVNLKTIKQNVLS